jgi:arylformamidase
MRWVEASMWLRPGITVWPGDTPFEMRPRGRIAAGGSSNTSILTLGTHLGTHIDAPWHFDEEGRKLDELDPALFFGDGLIIEYPGKQHIPPEFLPDKPLAARVLFKTANSLVPEDAPFSPDFIALEAGAAQALVDAGVRLVGIDGPSIAPYKQEGQRTHHILLDNGIPVVENLRLAGVSEGLRPFVALPLPVAHADGAPCRAFVGMEDVHG